MYPPCSKLCTKLNLDLGCIDGASSNLGYRLQRPRKPQLRMQHSGSDKGSASHVGRRHQDTSFHPPRWNAISLPTRELSSIVFLCERKYKQALVFFKYYYVFMQNYGTSATINIFCLSEKNKISPEDGWHGKKEQQAFFKFLQGEKVSNIGLLRLVQSVNILKYLLKFRFTKVCRKNRRLQLPPMSLVCTVNWTTSSSTSWAYRQRIPA